MEVGVVLVLSPGRGSHLALDFDDLRLKADILRSRPQTKGTYQSRTPLPGTLNAFCKKLLLEEETMTQGSNQLYIRGSEVLFSFFFYHPQTQIGMLEKIPLICCRVFLILILFWVIVRSLFRNHSHSALPL